MNLSKKESMDLHRFHMIMINSSGGKDSQAQLEYVVKLADAQGYPRDRIIVAHADLGRAEWAGTRQLAQEQAEHYGLRFEFIERPQGDLLEHIESRRDSVRARAERFESGNLEPADRKKARAYIVKVGKGSKKAEPRVIDWAQALVELARQDRNNPIWPSSEARYCTSDHKRGQVAKIITMLNQEHRERSNEPFRLLNCFGFRSQESPARAKRVEAMAQGQLNQQASNKSRQVIDWAPIGDWNEEAVWNSIKASGVRYHEAYDLGMPRLSCVFCIFAPKAALVIAGKANPALLEQYVQIEESIGHSFKQDCSMAEVKQAVEAGDVAGEISGDWNM